MSKDNLFIFPWTLVVPSLSLIIFNVREKVGEKHVRLVILLIMVGKLTKEI